MNDCITTTKQSTTKPCAYFLGYTVSKLCITGAEDPLVTDIFLAQSASNMETRHVISLIFVCITCTMLFNAYEIQFAMFSKPNFNLNFNCCELPKSVFIWLQRCGWCVSGGRIYSEIRWRFCIGDVESSCDIWYKACQRMRIILHIQILHIQKWNKNLRILPNVG